MEIEMFFYLKNFLDNINVNKILQRMANLNQNWIENKNNLMMEILNKMLNDLLIEKLVVR